MKRKVVIEIECEEKECGLCSHSVSMRGWEDSQLPTAKSVGLWENH